MSKTLLFCSTLALTLGLSLALPAYAEDAAMSGDAMMKKDSMAHHTDNMMHKGAKDKMKMNKMHESGKMGADTMSK